LAALSAATRIRKDYDIADIARYTCRKEEGEGDAEMPSAPEDQEVADEVRRFVAVRLGLR